MYLVPLKRIILFLFFLLLTINLNSCTNKGLQLKTIIYSSKEQKKEIKKIAIFPLKNFSKFRFAPNIVRNLLGLELLRLSNINYVPFSYIDKSLLLAGYQLSGDIPINVARDISNQYKADAFIMGVINEYGYISKSNLKMPYIDILLQLYDTSTGKLIWACKIYTKDLSLFTKLFGFNIPTMSDASIYVIDAAVQSMLKKLIINTSNKKNIKILTKKSQKPKINFSNFVIVVENGTK